VEFGDNDGFVLVTCGARWDIDVQNTGQLGSLEQTSPRSLINDQIPLGAGLVALTRVLYDREMAVSERRVKPADIINDPSLILGRQIIHILPEGYVKGTFFGILR